MQLEIQIEISQKKSFKKFDLNLKIIMWKIQNETYHVKTNEKHMSSSCHWKKLLISHKTHFCKYKLLDVHLNLAIDFVILM